MSKKYIWDLEANGLLKGNKLSAAADKIWMIVATDLETKETFVFCDHTEDKTAKPLLDFKILFDDAKELIGHNIINYDFPVLRKILGWEPNEKTVIRDTLLMSQMLDYMRFGGRHSLELWGNHLGVQKPVHEDWLNFSEDMVHRCKEDVKINEKVYRLLARELTNYLKASKTPQYMKTSLRVEHKIAEFQAQASRTGWVFDMKRALELEAEMIKELEDTRAEIEPKMPMRLKILDREGSKSEFKVPEYKKNGDYYASTVAHFQAEGSHIINADEAKTTRPLDGPFCRVRYLEADLGSIDYLKTYLYGLGWEPLDWNWEKKDGKFVKKSAKLCAESLRALGPEGARIDDFTTTRSRLGILRGWIANTDPETNRICGEMFTIATPTGRARHKTIVNVPSPNAAWGKEMRGLFGCRPGYKVVGSDSSGNQMRALCHYIKNEEFTAEVIDGDVHQKNADVLGCSRPTAKPWLYAFLFGAGLEKLGLILSGKRDKKLGGESKKKFVNSIPGFKLLIDKLNTIVHGSEARDSRASIPALDGRRIYLDSGHKALNYLLQSAEGITCKAAVAYTMDKFKEEGIDAEPLIFYHDEQQWEVREDQTARAAEICEEAFREAPKWFGVTCMDGEAMVGDNWYETH